MHLGLGAGRLRLLQNLSIISLALLPVIGCAETETDQPSPIQETQPDVSPESVITPLLDDPAVSDYVKGILEDFEVTEQEMREAEEAYTKCVATHGLEADISNQVYGATERSQDDWVARHPDLDRGEALEELSAAVGECADSTVGIVDSVYYSFR